MSAPIFRSTTAVQLVPGEPARPVTDNGNAPAGLFLINRGDNAGEILVQSGPTDTTSALAIGPGGSIPWTDPAVLPYAVLPPGATAGETLVVSSQVAGYENPTAVAAATAARLALQGVPNVLRDVELGTYRLSSGSTTQDIAVGECSTLVVSVDWPQPMPQGRGVCTLIFDDPLIPDLAETRIQLTCNNTFGEPAGVWHVPVYGPRLRVMQTDTADSDCYIAIVGTNRPAPARAVPHGFESTGTHTLWANTPTAAYYSLVGGGYHTIGSGPSSIPGGSSFTRLPGAVTLAWVTNSGTPTGVLIMNYVNGYGRQAFHPINIEKAVGTMKFALPNVPVYWQYRPDVTLAGAVFVLTVTQD